MRAAIFFLLALLSLPLLAQATTVTTTATQKTKKVVVSPLAAQASRAQNDIADPFFASVLKGEYHKGLEGLNQVFAIAEPKREYLAEQMQALEKKLGRAAAYERLGQKKLFGSQRVIAVYYATYHPLKPTIWELVYYFAPAVNGAEERWVLTSLRFETESVFETLQGVTP